MSKIAAQWDAGVICPQCETSGALLYSPEYDVTGSFILCPSAYECHGCGWFWEAPEKTPERSTA